jgi:hypothetical protein
MRGAQAQITRTVEGEAMNPEREALKQLAKLKDQLGEQIIQCGLKDETLGRACLLFADASYECLKARSIRMTQRQQYDFRVSIGGVRQTPGAGRKSAPALSEYEKKQNRHAAKCLWQWEGEIQFALNALNAAINDSTSPRLSVRLMSARTRLMQQTAERKREILRTCQTTDQKKISGRVKNQIAEFLEKHGQVAIVTHEGGAHMFSSHDAAEKFRRSTKELEETEAADRSYYSEGFISYAALMESIIDNPDLKKQWEEFCETADGKRGKHEAESRPE